MKFKHQIGSLLSAATVVAAISIQQASAVSVLVGPQADGGESTSHEYLEDYAAWFVADHADPVIPTPILLTIDTGAGAWTQTLTFGPGAPNLQNGDLFIVQELLQYSGGRVLNNWKQEILTPGWQWSDAAIFDNDTAELLTGLFVDLDPAEVRFTFDPLAQDQVIFIVKLLEYTGPDDAAPSPVVLSASAIPEPGSALFAMLGAAGLIFRPRRRSA